MSDVTRILSVIEVGDSEASEQLLPLVYDELRKLAAAKLAREAPGQTLQATALVHEAYVRLVEGDAVPHWNSRAHFFAAAAEAMRRILIDRARKKQRLKHGGGRRRIDFESIFPATEASAESLLAMDDALSKFSEENPKKAELIRLRYYANCSLAEAAELLGISTATANRYWSYARAWLYKELREA